MRRRAMAACPLAMRSLGAHINIFAIEACMLELARQQPGFLGVESARGEDGFGITVSYWSSVTPYGSFRMIPRLPVCSNPLGMATGCGAISSLKFSR